MPRVAPLRFRYRDCRCHQSVYLLTADAGVVRMSTYRVMGHLRRTRKVRGDLPQTRGVSDHPSIWLSFRLLFVPSGGVHATRETPLA